MAKQAVLLTSMPDMDTTAHYRTPATRIDAIAQELQALEPGDAPLGKECATQVEMYRWRNWLTAAAKRLGWVTRNVYAKLTPTEKAHTQVYILMLSNRTGQTRRAAIKLIDKTTL